MFSVSSLLTNQRALPCQPAPRSFGTYSHLKSSTQISTFLNIEAAEHSGVTMLSQVQLLDEMNEMTWRLLWENLTGITDEELDWKPHPEANTIRWIVGHLTWFEEWAHDAIRAEGRYLIDKRPEAYLDEPYQAIRSRYGAAYQRYRERTAQLTESELNQTRDFLGAAEVTILELLERHALHLAGHRYQIRYIRAPHARAHGLRKADFDPM